MLQAYATQMALDKLGYENETIDISGFNKEINRAKMFYFAKASFTSTIFLTKFGRVKEAIVRRIYRNEHTKGIAVRNKSFKRFEKQYFKMSPNYNSLKELSENCFKYEAVLVGSDQLWLPGNIAADYYTLSFVPEAVNSIAYATSFGQASLPKDSAKLASVFLKKIKHIGVREEAGQKLVKKLVGRNVPVVCDPTLLFTGEEWMSIQQEEAIVKEPYIFCYFLGSNGIHRQFVERLKEETGYKVVILPHIDEYVEGDKECSDIQMYDVDPADFLNLIRNAVYICTDSFHCSVFSILYQRKFFTFRRFANSNKQSTNSRLDTLFNFTGIDSCLMNGDENIEQCIANEIDFDTAHAKLEALRKESYSYLKAALLNERGTDL